MPEDGAARLLLFCLLVHPHGGTFHLPGLYNVGREALREVVALNKRTFAKALTDLTESETIISDEANRLFWVSCALRLVGPPQNPNVVKGYARSLAQLNPSSLVELAIESYIAFLEPFGATFLEPFANGFAINGKASPATMGTVARSSGTHPQPGLPTSGALSGVVLSSAKAPKKRDPLKTAVRNFDRQTGAGDRAAATETLKKTSQLLSERIPVVSATQKKSMSMSKIMSSSFAEKAQAQRKTQNQKSLDDSSYEPTPRIFPENGRTEPTIARGLDHETAWNQKNLEEAGKALQSHFDGNKSRPGGQGWSKPPTTKSERRIHAKARVDGILLHPETTVQYIERPPNGDPNDLSKGRVIDYREPSGHGVRYSETPLLAVSPRQPNDPPTRNDAQTLVGLLNPPNPNRRGTR